MSPPEQRRAPVADRGAESHHVGADGQQQDTSPPHLAAEAAALGSALWGVAYARGVVEQLQADDFDRHAHALVFEAVAALLDAGAHLDVITVTEQLAACDQLDAVGGAAAMHDLTTLEVCPVPAAWRTYCAIVKRHAARRRAIREHLAALRDLGVDVREGDAA